VKRIVLVALPLVGGALIAFRALPLQQGPKITVPQGFAVEEVLSPAEAQSVVALTFDAQGRMVLGKEFGNVVTLIPNGSGGFEQRIFSDQVHTTQGITVDGPDVIMGGTGPQGTGFYRLVDENNDARADRVELIELTTNTVQDHGPHSPIFGPDGYLYFTQGNFSYITEDASPISPVRHWEEAVLLEGKDARGFGDQYNGGPGGNVTRKAIPSKGAGNTPALGANSRGDFELFAHGFRNQYDGAFNLMGEMFTFDSDMEWDRDLPWYRGTSTVHTVEGGDFGYREGSDKHPRFYLDDAPIMADQGRGSPTGVTMLQTYNYPAEYWDYLLSADWSRGRVVGSRLARTGATYSDASPINFLYGEPLNVTDMEVGPDGNLYFALGGRSTSGGIYRLVYRGQNAMQKPAANTPLDRVLTMIQSRAPYSRELARATKAQLGNAWGNQLAAVVRNAQAPADRRVRALELLQVFGPVPDEALLNGLRGDQAWEVRAASTYYLGLKPTDSARRELVARLKDNDPFVQRRALDALLRTGISPAMQSPIDAVADVFPLLSSPDRQVRYAARNVLHAIDRNEWREAAFTASGYPQAPEALMAFIQTMDDRNIWDTHRLARRDAELLRANPTDAQLRDLVRVIQRTILVSNGVTNIPAGPSTLGVQQTRQATGINGGAPPRVPGAQQGPPGGGQGQQVQSPYTEIGALLLARFPTPDSLLNREMARVLASLETAGALPKLTAELSRPSNGREQQIHYAYMLGFMKNGWDAATVNQTTSWLEKVYKEQWKGGAGFGNAINTIRDKFLDNIPDSQNSLYTMASDRIRVAQAPPAPPAGAVAAAPAAPPAAGGGGGGGFAQPILNPEETFEEITYNPSVLASNPAGGAAAFQKAACITCHTFGPIGTELGPDLTTIGQRFSRRDIVRAIMFPHEQISDLYAAETVVRTTGGSVTGIVAGEDAASLKLMLSGSNTVTIPKSEIRSRAKSNQSVMPEGLLNLLNGNERNALIALLQAGPAAIPDTALTRIGRR
jgi:putative heme-binding domain-containing protein